MAASLRLDRKNAKIKLMKNTKLITFPNGKEAQTTLDERIQLRKELGFRDLEILENLPIESILGRRVMEVAERMRLA